MPEPRNDPRYRRMARYLRDLERIGIKLGLDNIRRLLGALGDPHRAYPAILIAGTNGKGSVAAMLASILERSGIRAGLYTSPHLVHLEERMAVDGAPIPPARLADQVLGLRDLIARERRGGRLRQPPTFFEVTTAAALAHFRDERVQIAILEVGMGGRFDATNVVDPLFSILTPIEIDHQEHLGDHLAAIAREKLGIVRPGGLVLTAPQLPEASAAIHAACHDRNARRIESAAVVRVVRCPSGEVSFLGGRWEIPPLTPALPGAHQLDNAATAVAACEILAQRFPITAAAVAAGIAAVRWPGRLQWIPGRPRWLLDGAHNPAAARALAGYLARSGDRPPVTLFGALADKDHEEMLRALAPICSDLILCPPDSSRAAGRDALLASTRRVGLQAEWIDSFPRAAAAAVRRAGPEGAVLVTGSLYLVGEALRWREGRAARRSRSGRRRPLEPESSTS